MRSIRRCLIAIAIAYAAACIPAGGYVAARSFAPDAGREIPSIALPREAQQVLHAIRSGGPFAFARDGATFGNYERQLPPRSRGYYREYTVPTPGVRSRGARRIIAGSGTEYYYSDDHYRTFRRIRE